MSKTEIYFFSGTGNSLYVAKELRRRLPQAELIPIVKLLHQDTIVSAGETVGLVFPLHGMTVPVPVRLFLRKVDLRSARYVFAVVTRAGTVSRAFEYVGKRLRKQDRRLDAGFVINMPHNDPKLVDFRVATKEEMTVLESTAQAQLDSIQEIVSHERKHREKDLTGVGFPFIRPIRYLVERLILFAMFLSERKGVKDYFYTDAKCTGCGICERVCLARKIRLAGGRPVWEEKVKCYMCYTCLNYCPAQAVQIKSKWYMKSYTPEKDRYPHPYATVDDIAGQK